MGTEEIELLEQAKVKELGLEDDANRRAAAMPLPGPSSKLLESGEIEINSNTRVRRVVAADWKVFQKLDSPIHQMALESQKDEAMRDEVKFDEVNEWELYWQFTHDIVEVLFATGLADEDDKKEWLETHPELPWQGDKSKYRQMVKKEIGYKLPVQQIRQVTAAVIQQFIASNSTKIGFTDGESKKKTN